MERIKVFSDKRHNLVCAYCGNGMPETRDHVPSKILLDEPFPANLPIVPCCKECNYNFSLDEEYFACAIECAICGTTEINKLSRDKVKRSLSRNTDLKNSLEGSFIEQDGQKTFKIEEERFKNVIVKLAKGHVKFEYSTPEFEEPNNIWIKSLFEMDQSEKDYFLQRDFNDPNKSPEVGSRAFSKLYVNSNDTINFQLWEIVQEGRYEYCVSTDFPETIVKIVISDYLAVEVIWR